MDTQLAPSLLIAAPTIEDARFERAVILLAEASDDGALGFVINQESPYTFADLAEELDMPEDSQFAEDVVSYGGPVSPERGWVLFANADAGDPDDMVMQIIEGVQLASTMDVLKRFLREEVNGPFRLLLGYAGWDAAQLEEEMAAGIWLPVEIDKALVFDTPLEDLWDAAVRKLGLVPGTFMFSRGGEA